ncbi:hypothetical protein AAFF_G00311640 [Aldrovandia affinis]|uniref:Uncharacterized protein n=1 Tax=Aldrovandia affinis TaxID=143900 RepID=A0AAD7SPE4_9TELE|nr:hypothetical protein AAFF_G00311640 [Aldrovandia affinis]
MLARLRDTPRRAPLPSHLREPGDTSRLCTSLVVRHGFLYSRQTRRSGIRRVGARYPTNPGHVSPLALGRLRYRSLRPWRGEQWRVSLAVQGASHILSLCWEGRSREPSGRIAEVIAKQPRWPWPSKRRTLRWKSDARPGDEITSEGNEITRDLGPAGRRRSPERR